MSLIEHIDVQFKEAMKSGDVVRRSVLSMLKAALHNYAIEKRKKDVPLGDEEVQEVIVSEVKKCKDAIEQYRAAERNDLVKKEEAEMAVLARYLPPQLSENEIETIVSDTIHSVHATSEKDIGKVMGRVSSTVKGRADMALVAQIVRKKLLG